MNDGKHVFSVAELAAAIRSVLEGCFSFVSVAGEISGLRQPSSGHLYFTVKDEQAQLRAVLFRMQRRHLDRLPRDGDMVVCQGRLSVYEARGDCQLIVDSMDFQGAGSLRLAFEQLKRKLAEEGLFDLGQKKTLPPMPSHIVLVTSPSGAAVHDFIRVAHHRCPQVRISICPAAVQGERAAAELREAIADVNQLALSGRIGAEVVVLCRGGGSSVDLAAFNDEQLARAIRHSSIPVVSAVGHEIDFTLADFAADLRAPTPSAAAELLLPDNSALVDRTEALARRLRRAGHDLLVGREARLDRLEHRLLQRSPEQVLAVQQNRADELERRLAQAANQLICGKEQSLVRVAGLLDAVSPLSILARGYAMARRKTGAKLAITSIGQVCLGEEIDVVLRQGRLSCVVTGMEKAADSGK